MKINIWPLYECAHICPSMNTYMYKHVNEYTHKTSFPSVTSFNLRNHTEVLALLFLFAAVSIEIHSVRMGCGGIVPDKSHHSWAHIRSLLAKAASGRG